VQAQRIEIIIIAHELSSLKYHPCFFNRNGEGFLPVIKE